MNNNNIDIELIQNYQLMYSKYDIKTLEYNIDKLSLKKLLLTQKLIPEFCKKYILNQDEHGMCFEDHYISINDILFVLSLHKQVCLLNDKPKRAF